MKCEFCNGVTESGKVRKQHWHRGRLYIVENVTAEICRTCGERYFHASTVCAVNAMLDREHLVKETLQVEVVAV